jgi:hypothetical protein
MTEKSDFQLQAPNSDHLLTLQVAAASCDVSRQAFHGWRVRPARVEGTRKLYALRDILDNRLSAARAARSPADADRERLEARIALARAQIERERVLADQAAAQYAPRAEALSVIAAAFERARSIITDLPAALLDEHPKISGADDLIQREISKALQPLQESAPPDLSPPTAAPD